MNDAVAEKHDFGAEVGRLLDLVVHSLYSEREIFLRELVANAADAMDRRRFEALTDPAIAPPTEAKVRIVPDKDARTLLIADDAGLRRVLAAIRRRAAFHSEDDDRLNERKPLARPGDWTSHPEVRDTETALRSSKRLIAMARGNA